MSSIESMFGNRGSGPYSRPLKVKVIKRDEAMTYRGGYGNQRQALSCAVSDGSSTAKLVCYDPAQFSRLSVGNTVMVRECIRKMEDTQPTIIVTKASKIFLTGAPTSRNSANKECITITRQKKGVCCWKDCSGMLFDSLNSLIPACTWYQQMTSCKQFGPRSGSRWYFEKKDFEKISRGQKK